MDTWDITTASIEPHHPVVLRSDHGAARTIAIDLPAGDLLQDHEVHEHTWLILIQGALEIEFDGSSQPAGPGFVAHWSPQERREIRATEDSRFLLVLAPWPGAGHPGSRE